ncbi:GNAT family N-acetyltransferase [Candidatus Woesearchaeota archaeon]|nr:GNAT family N-acetyltransferase [Candidatus Woesearchaeota archaeon]
MRNDITITDLREEHLRLIGYLVSKEFAQYGFAKTTGRQYLNNELQDKMFRIAEINKEGVGFILTTITPNIGAEIDYLAIDSEYKKQGIGTRLIKAIAVEMDKLSIDSISVNATPSAENFYANFFDYQKRRLWTAPTKNLIARIEAYEQSQHQLARIRNY